MTPMSHLFQELLVSVTPGMAGLASLAAGASSDRFGRKKMIIAASALFTIGALICAAAPEKLTLLAGRIVLGVTIGFASMIVPVYVGEASPAHIRGRLITGFQLAITFGFVVANVLAGGFSYIDPERIGWRLMVGFAAVPAVIQFVGFFFLPESPRWLAEHRRADEAELVLSKVYAGQQDWVRYEMDEIKAGCEEEQRAKAEYGDGFVLMRVLQTAHVRKALLIGGAMQILQQLAGINTLMYYTGTIIRAAGVRDTHTTIWISCGTAAINFLCTFIPLYLIERVGRRVLLLVSVAGVCISLLLLGGGFLLINKDTARIATDNQYLGVASNFRHVVDKCRSSNCDDCVTMEACGYCAPFVVNEANNSTAVNSAATFGQCLPVAEDDKDVSAVGFCANQSALSDNGGQYAWAHDYCQTKYTALPIVLMLVYLCFFSSGYGPIPWVFNAEVYPLWARSTCVSIATFLNWTFNLLIALTFLTLSEAITKYGAFFLYAGITFFAFIFFFIFVPETKGYPIEEIELLFMTKNKRRKAKAQVLHKDQAKKSADYGSTSINPPEVTKF